MHLLFAAATDSKIASRLHRFICLPRLSAMQSEYNLRSDLVLPCAAGASAAAAARQKLVALQLGSPDMMVLTGRDLVGDVGFGHFGPIYICLCLKSQESEREKKNGMCLAAPFRGAKNGGGGIKEVPQNGGRKLLSSTANCLPLGPPFSFSTSLFEPAL